MNSTLRRTVLQIHRWTGLTVGLVVIFLAITGLTLVFRPQLEPVVEREVMASAPCDAQLPLDNLIGQARAARPKVRLDEIELHGEPGASTLFRFADKQGVYVNPCTGAVLGQRDRWGGVFGTMEQWHRFRFINDADTGNFITGGTAFVMAILLVIGGLIVWWPPTLRVLKSSVKILPHLRVRALELHVNRTVALYASLVLLAISLSALPLAFKWVRYSMFAAVGSPMPPAKPQSAKPAEGQQPLSMGTLWARAQALVPESSEAVLSIPRKPLDAVEMYLVERDAPHPNARTYVYLDAYTGQVLRFEPYATSSLGNRIYRWLASLHMGYIGGVFGQLALFLGVLGVPVLGYTGIRTYLRKRFSASAPPPASRRRRPRSSPSSWSPRTASRCPTSRPALMSMCGSTKVWCGNIRFAARPGTRTGICSRSSAKRHRAAARGPCTSASRKAT